MAILPNKSVKEGVGESRQKRRAGEPSPLSSFIDSSKFVYFGLILLFCLLVFFLCSVQQSASVLQILPGKEARKNVTARIDFEYKSEIKTNALIEIQKRRIIPIYKINLEDYEKFEASIVGLLTNFNKLDEGWRELADDGKNEAVTQLTDSLASHDNIHEEVRLIRLIYEKMDSVARERIFREALMVLWEIYSVGVVGTENMDDLNLSNKVSLYRLKENVGSAETVKVLSYVYAMRRLNVNLRAIDAPNEVLNSLYRIFRQGLSPNLVYDNEANQAKEEEVLSKVVPVIVAVKKGTMIIEGGKEVTDLEYEKSTYYFKELKQRKRETSLFNPEFFEKMLLVLAIVIIALIYSHAAIPEVVKNNRLLGIIGLAIILNLVFFRLIFELGHTGIWKNQPELVSILPYIAPIALAPLIIEIMIGSAAAALVAFMIGAFYAVMQGGGMDMLLIAFLSSLIGIYICRNVHFRTSVVRANFFSGLSMACFAILLGMINKIEYIYISQHFVAAILVGGLSGIGVIGMLPIFESVFNRTTDITLLELSDYNHPLLRRLQLEAPGTYHHSLMVANLSENAALEMGANPLVCRVCSLYHDVGKLVKPNYFMENQVDGINPHLERNPSMSALVIKAHVKEGVELARKHNLPRIITDVIRQHHGTSLIQYFYYEALKKQNAAGGYTMPNAPTVKDVDEATYRYDGPRPRFKESAIIHFADSIEAASRSLKKVNKRNIEELLDHIFESRIKDQQLNECHMTIKEISQIKKSFTFTLLNMLHSRIEYPEGKPSNGESKENRVEHGKATSTA